MDETRRRVLKSILAGPWVITTPGLLMPVRVLGRAPNGPRFNYTEIVALDFSSVPMILAGGGQWRPSMAVVVPADEGMSGYHVNPADKIRPGELVTVDVEGRVKRYGGLAIAKRMPTRRG